MDVSPGGKRPFTGSGQDHRLDGVITLVVGQRIVEFAHQREAQRIELIRAVQCDDRDPIEILGQNALIGHRSLSFPSARLFDTTRERVFTQSSEGLARRGFRRVMMGGALEGIRVLELARFQAGPRGGMILSDLGAEVIKIEKFGGEETRKSPPLVRGQSVYFTVYNRGKKSVCLDMRSEGGKELFAALVKKSDIVLENFRPGVMHAMGFDYERLRALNPGI